MSDDWKLPWQGGCRCGALRVEITRPPLLASVCHCRGCQRMTGSAYSTTLTIPAGGFRVSAGSPLLGGLNGPVAHHHHCPECLSWVFTRAEGEDSFVNLRATMLDDARWFAPYVELWTSEKLRWAETYAVRTYTGQPPIEEYRTLAAEYAQRGSRPV